MAYLDVRAGIAGEVKQRPARVSAAPVTPHAAQVTRATETAGRWRLLSWSWVDGNAVAALEFLERSRDVANENVAADGADGLLHR
jgi:hypothetical protein